MYGIDMKRIEEVTVFKMIKNPIIIGGYTPVHVPPQPLYSLVMH